MLEATLDWSEAPALRTGSSLVRYVPETGFANLTHLQRSKPLKKSSEAAPRRDEACEATRGPEPRRFAPSSMFPKPET